MPQELKVRINHYEAIEEQIKNLGASFLKAYSFVDTYSNQPFGEVLKVSDSDGNYSFIAFKEVEGKFKETINKTLTKEKFLKTKTDLTHKYGIKRVLQGQRKIYQLEEFKITFNLIDGVGEFLILTGENPTEEFVTERLGIKNPEYIRVSFDELPTKQKD